MSEHELGLLRQRSLEARDSKAKRGELLFGLPPSQVWTPSGKIDKDPDLRVAEAIALVFRRFFELSSVRQTWLWCRGRDLSLPVLRPGDQGVHLEWKAPEYHNLLTTLRNPMHAGAYVLGRTGKRTHVVDGRARQTNGHQEPMEQWSVLIRDHHPCYISWDEYVRKQSLIADNAHMKKRTSRKAGRGGRALLSGMIRCGRCGYMMRVFYCSPRDRISGAQAGPTTKFWATYLMDGIAPRLEPRRPQPFFFWTVMTWGWVNSSNPSLPPSTPKPECLRPLNGMNGD